MAQFPETPAPVDPVIIEQEWRTLVTSLDSGDEQRKQKWSFPKWNVELRYELLTPQSQMQTLWNFYTARKGAYEAFHFYVRHPATYQGEFVGYGDGVYTTFDIPGKSTAAHTFYWDGASQSGNWDVLTGGGDSDSDRVQFSSAPPSGTLITCDFVGYLRIRCRFADDKMREERFYLSCYNTGLRLKGLSPK